MAYEHIERWVRPDSYLGAEWPEYYRSGVGQSRDSDALERSNFAAMLDLLGGESDTVIVARESHWAVGWVEWIAIHESDAAALQAADDANARLANYPVLDEEAFSELEWNEAADYWDGMSPRGKVQYAMDIRERYHWLTKEPVWPLGRLDYCELSNRGDTIAEAICESLRQ